MKTKTLLFFQLIALITSFVFASSAFSDSVSLISMSDTQMKYCAPVVPIGYNDNGTLKMIKIELGTLQTIYLVWYLDSQKICNFDFEINKSPKFMWMYDIVAKYFSLIAAAELNSVGIHTLRVEMYDESNNLLASDEKTYEIVSCEGPSLTLGAPSPYCLENPPDTILSSFTGDGSGSVIAYWTDEQGRWCSTLLREGPFNAMNTIPRFMIDAVFNTAGFHFLRLDAQLNDDLNNDGPFVSDTIVFLVNPCTVPAVATTAVSSITDNSAASGGDVTDAGGTTVTARGVCWSTLENPTVDLPTKTEDGSGTGIFTSSITGLTADTPYHVRAYATNSTGTGYGEDVSFATASVLYVSASGCGDKTPCYSTIQTALNAAADGDTIQAAKTLTPEEPVWSKTGTVTIRGGWKTDFTGQDGTTSMYAPRATGGGGVKVMPNVKIIPKP